MKIKERIKNIKEYMEASERARALAGVQEKGVILILARDGQLLLHQAAVCSTEELSLIIDLAEMQLNKNSVRTYLSKIGKIKTKKKAASSRENGKLGGRPKKKKD